MVRGKIGQTTPRANKNLGLALLCPLESSKWTKQSNTYILFVHQHKARQRKGRGSQILPENRAKYWTLNVPIQHPHKKVTGQKTRSAAIKKNSPHRKPTQQEKHKNRSGTRRVPEKSARKRARRARKKRAENSP